MSRLRATLSTSPVDQTIAQRVERARQEIVGALQACVAMQRNAPLVTRRRSMAVRRDLEKILGAMDSVRRVHAPYDVTDPDLTDTPQVPREKRPVPLPVASAPEE